MKKFLFLSVAILAFVMASCSKEARLNRKLDGKWEVTTEAGVAVEDADKYTITFTKDKKGKGTLVFASTVDALAIAGTYELDKNEKITITFTGSTTPEVLTVKEYSKSKLVLVDSDNYETEFKKL